MNFKPGDRVGFKGCIWGIVNGLLPDAVGTVVAQLSPDKVQVAWDDNPAASKQGWCPGCLIPLHDEKPMANAQFFKSIGWKGPVKETEPA